MAGETDMEAALTALLQTICDRVYPDSAPELSASWLTYQHIGGTPLRFIEGGAASLRHSVVQIDAWATTKATALTLIRQVEDALCTAAGMTARPLAEPGRLDTDDPSYYGMSQDFDIWFDR